MSGKKKRRPRFEDDGGITNGLFDVRWYYNLGEGSRREPVRRYEDRPLHDSDGALKEESRLRERRHARGRP